MSPYRHREESVVIDELIIPSNLRLSTRFHQCIRDARTMLLALAGPRLPARSWYGSRIFVTRGGTSTDRDLLGRERVIDFARQHGFDIVDPLQLSIGDQIATFRAAKAIIGEYGSALHNSLCALRGTASHPGFIQSGLGDACGHQTGYVFGTTTNGETDYSFEINDRDLLIAMRCMDVWVDAYR